jgi:hypothetical protein
MVWNRWERGRVYAHTLRASRLWFTPAFGSHVPVGPPCTKSASRVFAWRSRIVADQVRRLMDEMLGKEPPQSFGVTWLIAVTPSDSPGMTSRPDYDHCKSTAWPVDGNPILHNPRPACGGMRFRSCATVRRGVCRCRSWCAPGGMSTFSLRSNHTLGLVAKSPRVVVTLDNHRACWLT